MTSITDKPNGRQPQWKTTSIEVCPLPHLYARQSYEIPNFTILEWGMIEQSIKRKYIIKNPPNINSGLQKPWSRGTCGTKEGFLFVGRFWKLNKLLCKILHNFCNFLLSSAEAIQTLKLVYLVKMKYIGSVLWQFVEFLPTNIVGRFITSFWVLGRMMCFCDPASTKYYINQNNLTKSPCFDIIVTQPSLLYYYK